MAKLFPVLIIRNCDPADPVAFSLELSVSTIGEMHRETGEFLLKALEHWHTYKVQTGTEPHIHVDPRMLTRKQITEIEVIDLLNDPRTYTESPS